MSWIGNLSATYDVCSNTAGINVGNQDDCLVPIGHTLKKADNIIYLNETGCLLRVDRTDLIICVPCTEESEGRTAKGAINKPHPLFDQIKYICTEKYLDNLLKWINYLNNKQPNHLLAVKALSAVYTYVKTSSLLKDLGTYNIKIKDNLFICFCVDINGSYENRLWMMPEIRDSWYDYLINNYMITQNKPKDICFVSGETESIYTENHPKNINRFTANAKIITGNDVSNFTYRGRFTVSSQAVTVSYEASQKAHQALRWLINKQSYRCDSQAITAWAIDEMPSVASFYSDSYNIYNTLPLSDTDKITEAENITDINYSNALKKTLSGYGNADKLKKHSRCIAIIVTDATTKNTGRMSVTYYRELRENEYNERIADWHTACSWYQPYDKDRDKKLKSNYFIGAPSFDRITTAVLGKRKHGEDNSYDKMKKVIRERLLHCLFDGEHIPMDFVNSAVHHASNPLKFEITGAKTTTDRWRDWEQVLCSACTLVKRYFHDYKKEEFIVALEEDRTDRDYLYGRLLAVADRIEFLARYKQGNSKNDARATNAIRYMNVFSQHPFRTWCTLFSQQLIPYIQQLNGAGWYMNLIEEINLKFKKIEKDNITEYEIDTPLNGSYLLGFFAQRHEFKKNKDKNNIKDEGEDNEH